jgi:hypothetical protein
VAHGPAVPQDDRVHRAECGGVGGQLVEVLEHELLARVGDVEAVVTHESRGGEDLADGRRRAAEDVEVQAPVQVPDAEPVGLPLVQGRGQRRPDPGTDETDQGTAGGAAHGCLRPMYQLVS